VEGASGQALETLQVRGQDGRVLNAEDCLRRVVRHG